MQSLVSTLQPVAWNTNTSEDDFSASPQEHNNFECQLFSRPPEMSIHPEKTFQPVSGNTSTVDVDFSAGTVTYSSWRLRFGRSPEDIDKLQRQLCSRSLGLEQIKEKEERETEVKDKGRK